MQILTYRQSEQTMTEHSLVQSIKPSESTSPAERQPANNELRALLNRGRLEAILVVVTAIAIAASLVTERLNGPDWLILTINIISYVAGGIFGVKASIESLRERKLTLDLLMVLAAIGAASVNQWREGAILLFLFSLSNVLQNYAMDRSRNAIRALLKLRPNEATLKRGSELVVVPVESLALGDVILIRPGERLPIDGKVIDGE